MARIKESVGKTNYHFFYNIPEIHDKHSALEWVANIPSIKVLHIKSIQIGEKTIVPYKMFSPEEFVKKYEEYPCDKISISLNFHQYELMLVIDVCSCLIELRFPKTTMIDYQMVEDCLQLCA